MDKNFDKDKNYFHHEGVPVVISRFLPFRRRFGVCDIKTRQEYFIEGELIDSFRLGHTFYCSKEVFDQLKECYVKESKPANIQ